MKAAHAAALAAVFAVAAGLGWMLNRPPRPALEARASAAEIPDSVRALLDAQLGPHQSTAAAAAAPAWQAEQLPPPGAPQRHLALRALAEEGNAYAALEYSALLEECEFHRPASPEQIDRRAVAQAVLKSDLQAAVIEQLEQQLQTDLPVPPVDEAALAESLVAKQQRAKVACADIDARTAGAEWRRWYEQAAVLGHPDAQLGYWGQLLQRDRSHPAETMRRKARARQFLAAARSFRCE